MIVVLGFNFYPRSFGLATALKDSKEYARLAKSTNQSDVKENVYTIAQAFVWFQRLILEMVLSSIIDAFIILMYIWTFFETLFPGGKRITIAMGCSRGHHRSEVFDSIRVSRVVVFLLTLMSIVATARKQMNRENDKPSLTSTYALCANFMFAS